MLERASLDALSPRVTATARVDACSSRFIQQLGTRQGLRIRVRSIAHICRPGGQNGANPGVAPAAPMVVPTMVPGLQGPASKLYDNLLGKNPGQMGPMQMGPGARHRRRLRLRRRDRRRGLPDPDRALGPSLRARIGRAARSSGDFCAFV